MHTHPKERSGGREFQSKTFEKKVTLNWSFQKEKSEMETSNHIPVFNAFLS